jgi:23S rRNA (adenine2503-C2)-methyltransferase
MEAERITVTVRRSRGKDIDAACGQLANKAEGE